MTRSLATSAARSKTERLAHVGESTGVSRLIRQLGAWNGVMAFAYHRVGAMDPAYGFDEHTRQCLANHGVEFGFSFYGGYRTFDDWDPYDIRRRCLGPGVSTERFALTLTLPQVFAWR
jgi:hypothetical protein